MSTLKGHSRRILFICKKNETYGFVHNNRKSSGLYNSTRFIVESLQVRGIQAEIVEVTDNNCINREVTRYKPDIVVIEALWVVPEKFDVLKHLHPHVQWFVHLHSHIPFLAQEGIAMQWLSSYVASGVKVIANNLHAYNALRTLIPRTHVRLLPNVYISLPRRARLPSKKYELHVGCFGALRPMKNQLLQAMAAILVARRQNKHLYFHINASRVELGGEPVLKNLRQLFRATSGTTLIEHPWMEPEDFLELLQHKIDVGMQVSMTETFNVVCADYVTAGIPVVVSKEVTWLPEFCQAEDNDVYSMASTIEAVQEFRLLTWLNQWLLRRFSKRAQKKWFDFVMMHTDKKVVPMKWFDDGIDGC